MANLTINGIDITLQATLSGTNFTLTGTNSSGSIITGYSFLQNNEPGVNSNNYGIQYQIIEHTGGSLSVTHFGIPDEEINIWTDLPADDSDVGGGDPTGPRGTEVTVKSSTGNE